VPNSTGLKRKIKSLLNLPLPSPDKCGRQAELSVRATGSDCTLFGE